MGHRSPYLPISLPPPPPARHSWAGGSTKPGTSVWLPPSKCSGGATGRRRPLWMLPEFQTAAAYGLIFLVLLGACLHELSSLAATPQSRVGPGSAAPPPLPPCGRGARCRPAPVPRGGVVTLAHLQGVGSASSYDNQQTPAAAAAALLRRRAAAAAAAPPQGAPFPHPFPEFAGVYRMADRDASPRCIRSYICDNDYACGPDGLGCVRSAAARQARVRDAIRWSWQGYRWVASGHGV
jgi:hypothetical protein